MILEWFESIRTKATKSAKDWGYVYQNISLKFRARRCAKAWASHNEASKQFIRDQVAKVNPKSVVVIGSGLLLEIPIETLLEKTETIFLVDLVHAPEIRKLARKNPKIKLIEKDITSLLGILKKGSGPFQLKNIPWQQLPTWNLPKADMVISANLLSQISLAISESVPMTTETYEKFARKVRDQHIERLFEVAPSVVLFADFKTLYIDRNDKVLKTESFEVNLRSLKLDRQWKWDIAPFGEVSKDYRIEMNVKAYTN